MNDDLETALSYFHAAKFNLLIADYHHQQNKTTRNAPIRQAHPPFHTTPSFSQKHPPNNRPTLRQSL
jgi:hypothetical protein